MSTALKIFALMKHRRSGEFRVANMSAVSCNVIIVVVRLYVLYHSIQAQRDEFLSANHDVVIEFRPSGSLCVIYEELRMTHSSTRAFPKDLLPSPKLLLGGWLRCCRVYYCCHILSYR